MTDEPVTLDSRRGMSAQRATDLRRLQADVEANERHLRERQELLQQQMIASPAADWEEAAGKARYVINRLAAGPLLPDPRLMRLIEAVLADFARLSQRMER